MDYKKQFIKLCENAKWGSYKIFTDFVKLASISLYNLIAKDENLELEYKNILSNYDKDEIQIFPQLLSIITEALENEIQDFLGSVYEELSINNKNLAQYFTPFHISEMTSKIVLPKEDTEAMIEEKGYISLCEPTCGSGAMIIGVIKTLKEYNINYQQNLLVHMTDLDEICFYMSYIQMSLLGVPAIVHHGNTLSMEIFKSLGTLFYFMNKERFEMLDYAKNIKNVLNNIDNIDNIENSKVEERSKEVSNVETSDIQTNQKIKTNEIINIKEIQGQLSFNF